MAGRASEVLVVEDDPLVAVAVQNAVEFGGYKVCGIAATGAQALEIARIHSPSLAVMDVDLGDGVSGIEAARKLLTLGPIGILFVTGFGIRTDGADVGLAWLPKPWRLFDLVQAVNVVASLSEERPITVPIPPDLRFIKSMRAGPGTAV
jgi:CheY-like chemotaxis protein